MATIIPTGTQFTIASADLFVLGDASDAFVGTFTLQGTAAAFVGTGLVVKGRVRDSGAAWVPIPYVRRSLAAAASDDTVVSAALAGSFLIKVDATGLEIALDNGTGYTSGSFVVEVCRVEGAAA